MVKIKGKSTCPGCNKDHDVEIDIDKLDVKTQPAPQVTDVQTTGAQATQQIQKEVIEKEVVKEVVPDFMPKFRCKDGNCDIGNHKNKNYKRRPKGKCTNCGQFARNKEGACPWCKDDEGKAGEIEEIDDEELDELGIPYPPEQEEHDHEH